MVKKSNSPIEILKVQIAASLAAIGVDARGIIVVERGLALPFINMQITLKINESGERVWQCIERYSAVGFDVENERSLSVIRFEEPLEQPLRISRAIALHVATVRIDAALDAIA